MSVWTRLWLFQWSCMDVRVGLWRKLSAEELMLLNCGVGEDSWESLGLQGDPTSPSWRRSVVGVYWKDWCWSSNTLATSCKELTHWKRPWCWEGLGTGGEGDDREWDGWMASLTLWTWIWVNSGSSWWTGRPGMLRFMGSQRVGHDWVTELSWLTTLMAESKYELKNLLMRMKEESEKAGLKLNIQKTKIMAYSPITSWHMWKKWRQWQIFFSFLGLQNHCKWWPQPWD